MLDRYYEYQFVHVNTKPIAGDEYREHKYVFDGKGNHRYIVLVEEYNYSVYAVKFFLKSHNNSSHKYKLLTHFYDASAVIRTCINIMLEFYRKDPYASFGFIGARSTNEKQEGTSKRFRVYRTAIANLISPVQFIHLEKVESNAYLMLNRDSQEVLPEIEQMFSRYYPLLEDS